METGLGIHLGLWKTAYMRGEVSQRGKDSEAQIASALGKKPFPLMNPYPEAAPGVIASIPVSGSRRQSLPHPPHQPSSGNQEEKKNLEEQSDGGSPMVSRSLEYTQHP